MSMDQTLVIAISPHTARRARAYIDQSEAYKSISEFVEVAIENQLALEDGSAPHEHDSAATAEILSDSPSPPELAIATTAPKLLDVEPVPRLALYSLTNRLFPLKIAVRVLSNLEGQASVNDFQRAAAQAARQVGLRLRIEDAEAGRRGLDRRWIALPVGSDETAAQNRFVNFFTLGISAADEAFGPLAQLGLAGIEDGSPRLTKLGYRLATAPSPILDPSQESVDSVLSTSECECLITAIRSNLDEVTATIEFLNSVKSADGRQSAVDETIMRLHPDWSKPQAVAHRAAMAGRLHDLGIVETEGRGADAHIHILDTTDAFAGAIGA